MIQVAVYGKGGIGKSTVSSNISYMLAESGKKVIQIGCDPKHDSTRSLLGGNAQTTVLSYIRDTPVEDRSLDDIVRCGSHGVMCVEAGGPEPGIGCAGRGILSTFDTLKKLGVDDTECDVRLYDVLGDVVCGGFAVPLRSEYADAVYIVTSGEFMAMYAANNILKGIRNYDHDAPRVAGIVLNCRGLRHEDELAARFSEAVGLPIVARIPRSGLFAEAEAEGMCLSERFPDSDIASIFGELAASVSGIGAGTRLYRAHPLSDKGLNDMMAGRRPSPEDGYAGARCNALRLTGPKRSGRKDILDFCAAGGALNATYTVDGLVTVIHGPMSCGNILTSALKYSAVPMKAPGIHMSHRVTCTAMDDFTAIFGGNGTLEKKLRSLLDGGFRDIVVVTTCTPGIIGDNSEDLAASLESEYGGSFVRIIRTDGNILGDWIDGYLEAARVMSDMIDPDVEPDDGCVNLIAERYYHTDDARNEVMDLLEPFGLRVNCRFMNRTDTGSVRNFMRGKYNLTFGKDPYSDGVSRILTEKLGISVESVVVPRGLNETLGWIDRISEMTGRYDRGRSFAGEVTERYMRGVGRLKAELEGSSCAVMSMFSTNIDWLLELLRDLGVEVSLVADDTHGNVLEGSPYADTVRRCEKAGEEEFASLVAEVSPDFALSDSVFTELGVPFMKYGSPWPGIDDVLLFAEKMARIGHLPEITGWRE